MKTQLMFFYVYMSSLNHKLINLSKQQLQKSTSKGNKGPWSFMSIHKRNSIFIAHKKLNVVMDFLTLFFSEFLKKPESLHVNVSFQACWTLHTMTHDVHVHIAAAPKSTSLWETYVLKVFKCDREVISYTLITLFRKK